MTSGPTSECGTVVLRSESGKCRGQEPQVFVVEERAACDQSVIKNGADRSQASAAWGLRKAQSGQVVTARLWDLP